MDLKGFLLKASYVFSAIWIIFCFNIQDVGILEYAPVDKDKLMFFWAWLLGPLILWWFMIWALFDFKI